MKDEGSRVVSIMSGLTLKQERVWFHGNDSFLAKGNFYFYF